MKARFCYEVSAAAKLAEDDTGMSCPAFVSTSFDDAHGEPIEVPDEQYKLQHAGAIRQMVAGLLGVDESMLTPMSAEEYDLAVEGDDPDQDEEDMA